MLSIKPLLLVVALLFAVVVSADRTILDIIQNIPQLSIFNRHLNDPVNIRLYNLLSNSDNQLTVFAPLDDAFIELERMLSANARVTINENEIQKALNYHIIPDQALSTRDLTEGFQQYPTLYNTESLSPYARLRMAKMRYSIPQDLTNGLIIYGRNRDLNILRGLGVPAHIVKNDIPALNGVVHIIDKVLVPPLSVLKTLELRGLNRAVENIRMTNAADMFQSLSNVTILIPTNEALATFAVAHPDITLESLRRILLNHVIPGYYFSFDLEQRPDLTLATKYGSLLRVSTAPGRGLYIGDATITKANILTQTAVLHEIDRVLVPDEFKLSEDEQEE